MPFSSTSSAPSAASSMPRGRFIRSGPQIQEAKTSRRNFGAGFAGGSRHGPVQLVLCHKWSPRFDTEKKRKPRLSDQRDHTTGALRIRKKKRVGCYAVDVSQLAPSHCCSASNAPSASQTDPVVLRRAQEFQFRFPRSTRTYYANCSTSVGSPDGERSKRISDWSRTRPPQRSRPTTNGLHREGRSHRAMRESCSKQRRG